MKKGFLKRIAAGFVSGLMCLTMFPQALASNAANVGDKLSVGNGVNQHKGNCDGYSYEVWIDTTGGSGSMTLGEGAAFKAEWSANVSSGNFLARRGLDFGSQKKATDYPYIGLDYDADYTQTGSANGNSRLCVYGWFQNQGLSNVPLVEYYIIEDWVDWCPDADGTMVTIDGAQYKIFQMDHTGPTINGGSETFKQYFSVRQDKRTSGHITVSDHFKAWEDQGWGIGNLYEVALNAEGWQSSGVADVKMLDVYTDPSQAGNSGNGNVTPSVEPDSDGYYFHSTFEDGKDGWAARGDTSLSNDSKNYYDGSSSLLVSGRTDTWQGTGYSLSTDAFVPGSAYSFSAAVLQTSGSSEEMKLTLQYTDSSGETNYDTVASAVAKNGEWTLLENTSYTIPSGASSLLLYVETDSSLTDFYIDEAIGAVKGTKSSVKTGGGTVETSSSTTTSPDVTTDDIGKTTTTTSSNQTTTTTTAQGGVSDRVWGDANEDGMVNMADAVIIMQVNANPDKYQLTAQGRANADVIGNDGVTNKDALAIQQFEAGIIDSLPVDYPDGYDSTNTKSTSKDSVTTSSVKNSISITASFENGNDGWESRGGASVTADSDSYYSGSKSLLVTGRSDNWEGTAISLDGTGIKAGGTYSISAAVMQASGASEKFKITLQYTDADGETQYDTVATETAKDKTWTAIGNTAYTVPNGASDLLLYIETSDTLTDFYVDDVQIADEGTEIKVKTGGGTVGSNAGNSNVSRPADGSVDISWIDPTKPMVAICFDDGASATSQSDPAYRIINAIADSGFHATFFYVGNWTTNSNQNEVKYAFEKGMEIANHSTSHPYLTNLSAAEIRSEYETTQEKLRSIIGAEPSAMMRLPYLASNSTVTSTLNDVALISCSVDSQDWNGASANDIINTVKTAMNNGTLDNAIVLCHETYSSTAEAMEYLAPYLKEQGWQIVTVSELFAVNGQELKGGVVYNKCG